MKIRTCAGNTVCFIICLVFFHQAAALADDGTGMSDYTAFPPFLSAIQKPNVLKKQTNSSRR